MALYMIVIAALVLILRQRKRKPRVVGSDQQILTSIERIRHGSIGHKLSQVYMPQGLARSGIHAQKVSERIAPEQKISRRRQQAGDKHTALIAQLVGPHNLTRLVIDGVQYIVWRRAKTAITRGGEIRPGAGCIDKN